MAADPTPAPAQNRSALERALSVFTEVRAGEGISAIVLAINIFLILTAYYLVKPVREALILSLPGGAEIKSYTAAGQALLLLAIVPAYGWLASRVPRMRLIDSVTIFYAVCMIGFYVLIMNDAPVAIAFFLWVGIYGLMIPAQFWAFANEIYTPAAGKRLFVLIAFGASSGAVFGSFLANVIIDRVGVYEMLFAGAALLGLTPLLTHFVYRREQAAASVPSIPEQTAVHEREEPLASGNAFRFVLRNKYLLLLAFMLLINNWVNTNGEYILGRIVEDAAAAGEAAGGVPADAYIAAFYARFFGIVNLAGMLLQLFIVSRVIKYIGVPIAICLLPAITLGSYLAIFALPLLGVVRWVKTAENSTDYSLQSTVKQVLYLPTTRTEKYKAKQAIDTFFVRAGDLCSAALVYVGTTMLAFDVPQFAMTTALLSLVWLLVARVLGRRYREKVPLEEGSARKPLGAGSQAGAI